MSTNLWKTIGFSLVLGSALTFAACSTPMATKPAAQPTAKPAAAAVNASKTTETKPAAQTQPLTETKTTTETKPATQTQPVTETKSTTETTSSGAQSATSATPMVMLHEDAKLGKILVDNKGMTLYIFDKDSADKSTCSGGCVTKWPLLTATSEKEAIAAGEGVTAKFGIIKRDDGKYQVTANGMPLYYYAEDKAAGDVKGQAVGDVWWVIGADGSKITSK